MLEKATFFLLHFRNDIRKKKDFAHTWHLPGQAKMDNFSICATQTLPLWWKGVLRGRNNPCYVCYVFFFFHFSQTWRERAFSHFSPPARNSGALRLPHRTPRPRGWMGTRTAAVLHGGSVLWRAPRTRLWVEQDTEAISRVGTLVIVLARL